MDEIKKKIFSLPEDILDLALTHKSYSKTKNNEQLEFLGDAVLNLAVGYLIFSKFPNKKEGELSLLRSNLVNVDSLFKIAKKIRIGDWIKFKTYDQKLTKNILADTLEALFGAYFIYYGWEKTQDLIFEIFKNEVENLNFDKLKNPKNILQEYYQKIGSNLPNYKVIKEMGPEHRKKFVVGIFLNDKKLSQATGSSIKEAEIKAAEKLIKKLKLI
jgi:ribonuclease-3